MDRIYGMLGLSAKAGKVLSGTDSVLDGIKRKKAKLVIIANDASDKTKKEIKFICEKYDVPLIIFGETRTNSHAIGKENRVIFAITDTGLAKAIKELADKAVG